MVLKGPGVELENQITLGDEALVFGATMRALATEQTLIPPAAGFDVAHRDEGLGSHLADPTTPPTGCPRSSIDNVAADGEARVQARARWEVPATVTGVPGVPLTIGAATPWPV